MTRYLLWFPIFFCVLSFIGCEKSSCTEPLSDFSYPQNLIWKLDTLTDQWDSPTIWTDSLREEFNITFTDLEEGLDSLNICPSEKKEILAKYQEWGLGVYNYHGDYLVALQLFEKGMKYVQENNLSNRETEVWFNVQLANTNFSLKNYQTAIKYGNQAQIIFDALDNSSKKDWAEELASLNNTFGQYWQLIDSVNKSEHHFQEAIRIHRVHINNISNDGSHEEIQEQISYLGEYYSSYANIFVLANQRTPNQSYVKNCFLNLEILDSIIHELEDSDHKTELKENYWNTKSLIYSHVKNPDVWAAFDSLLTYDALPNEKAVYYNNLGFAYQRINRDLWKSLEAFQQAATFLDNSFEPRSIIDVPQRIVTTASLYNPFSRNQLINLKGFATTYHRLYDETNERKYLEQALILHSKLDTLITHMRQMFPNLRDKQILAYDSPDIYEDAIQVCYKLIHLGDRSAMEDAFRFIQANKAPSLREKIQLREAKNLTGISDATHRRLVQLQDAQQEGKIQFDQYLRALDSIFVSNPRLSSLLFGGNITSLSTVKKKVEKDSLAVLEYAWLDTSLFCMVIQPDTTFLHNLGRPDSIDLERAIIGFRKSLIPIELEAPEPILILEKGKVLYDRLFEPIARHLTRKTKKLVIMPDRALYHLPFEALVRNEEATSYSDADYLIEDYAISYTPNSTMMTLRDNIQSSSESEFVLFTPTFSSRGQKFLPTIQPNGIPDYIWSQVRDSVLAPISISKKKWKKIVDRWGMKHNDSQKNTKEYFIKRASKEKYVLLVTHGNYESRDPLYSWLAFNADPKSRQNIPYLFAKDIYAHEFPIKLLILLGCETGLGELERGEGSISLARAFLYQGTESVLQTLWSIKGQQEARILEIFLEEMNKNKKNFSVALQFAKRRFLHENKDQGRFENFLNPYYWSGLVLIGAYN